MGEGWGGDGALTMVIYLLREQRFEEAGWTHGLHLEVRRSEKDLFFSPLIWPGIFLISFI
jgi:hypothetical protein